MTISAKGLYHNFKTFAWNVLEKYSLQDYEWKVIKTAIEACPEKIINRDDFKAFYDYDWSTFTSYKITEKDWLEFKRILEYYIETQDKENAV